MLHPIKAAGLYMSSLRETEDHYISHFQTQATILADQSNITHSPYVGCLPALSDQLIDSSMGGVEVQLSQFDPSATGGAVASVVRV